MSAISGINGASPAQSYSSIQSAPSHKAAQSQSPQQDSVQLSAAAKAAAGGGDVDHDGDSH